MPSALGEEAHDWRRRRRRKRNLRSRIVGPRSGAGFSVKGEHVVSLGHEMQVARALGAVASARTAIAVVWNRIRRWRASIIQRRPQIAHDLDEPARVDLPDEPWQRPQCNSDACPFIRRSPEARFSLRTQGLRPKIRIDCAADDLGPQALAWSGAQLLSRDRTKRRRSQRQASKHDPWSKRPAINRKLVDPTTRATASARNVPCARRRDLCLGPADLRLLLRLPDSALGRAVARSASHRLRTCTRPAWSCRSCACLRSDRCWTWC